MRSKTRSFQRTRFEVWIVWKFGFELYFNNLHFILQALSPYHSAFSRTVEKRDREGLKLIGGCLESIWKVFGGCLVS